MSVLHIEDDDQDAFLLAHAVARAALPITLHRAADGREAMAYLLGIGDYADRETYPVPEVILLDLKLPQLSGFEVLAWLRGRPEYRAVPVYVLSSSDLVEDHRMALEMGATGFMTKTALMPSQLLRVLRPPAAGGVPADAVGNGSESGLEQVGAGATR